VIRFTTTISITLLLIATSFADDDKAHGPTDPIASVDGDPVFVGEMNLIVAERFGPKKLQQAGADLKRATAVLLVRRHLAMKTLRETGGDTLAAMIQRRLDAMTVELERRDSSLSKFAESRMSDEKSLIADQSWKVAWGQYMKSKMNDKNLRSYFDKNRNQYGGTFDELTDQAALRRDATSAMFDALVRKQKTAKIQWFIDSLHPPDGVSIIPQVETTNGQRTTNNGQ